MRMTNITAKTIDNQKLIERIVNRGKKIDSIDGDLCDKNSYGCTNPLS
jgi:hypothetical protein